MATFTVTNTDDSGPGSLRQAVLDANANPNANGPDQIVFDAGVFDGEADDLIRLTSGALPVTDALVVDGGPAGVTISGDARGNDVTVGNGITSVGVSLARDVSTDGVDNDGDGLTDEAGEDLLDDNSRIFNATSGDLTLIGLTLTGGRTTADLERGGAVRAAGALTLEGVTVTGNSTEGRYASGGGVAATGVLTATGSTFLRNLTQGQSADGGGLFGNVVTLTNTTLAENRTLGRDADGGGAFGTTLTLTNATVTGNTTAGDLASGGGVYGFRFVTLADGIVLGNVAFAAGGDEVGLAPAGFGPAATLTLTGGNILGRDGGGGADVFDGGADAGDTSAAAVFAATVDIGGGVLAGALGDNGGRVPTIALRADALNPALDAAQGGGVATDARGVAAVDVPVAGASGSGAAVRDLGAFELDGPVAEAPRLIVDTALDVVDPFDGLTSLREAVAFANATAGEDAITFAPAVAGATLRLTQGEFAVTDALVVEGGPAGVTLSGEGQSRIFNASAPLTLDELTLTGGRATRGGAVYSSSELTVVDSTLHGNVAAIGGAIAAGFFYSPSTATAARVELTRSVIRDNLAVGEYVSGYGAFFGPVAIGGGLYVRGDLVARDSAIIGNTAGSGFGRLQAAGGGINFGGAAFGLSQAVLDLANVTIANNRTFSDGVHTTLAGQHGAAISVAYLASGRLDNVTITGNVSYRRDFLGDLQVQAKAISVSGIRPARIEVTNSIVVGNSVGRNNESAGYSSGPIFVGANIADQGVAGPDYVAAQLFDADGNFVRAVAPGEIFAETEIATPETIAPLLAGVSPSAATRVVVSGTVRDNGGPVPTVALRGGANPALDASAGGTVADARGVAAFDQPGLAGVRDLGAFELDGPAEEVSLVVTTAADVVDGADGVTSLREAIIYANFLPGADTITFDPAVFDGGPDAVIRLGDLGALRVEGELTIQGGPAGVTITGDRAGDDILISGGPLSDAAASLEAGRVDDNTRLFVVQGDLALENLTLTGGRAEGATFVVRSGVINGTPATLGPQRVEGGGAIWSDGAVTLTDSALIGNGSDSEGGGVKSVDLQVTGGLLNGNVASLRGGGAIALTIDVTDSTVDGNRGGGLSAKLGEDLRTNDPDGNDAGSLTVTRSTIGNNRNEGSDGGGGLYTNGQATVTGSLIVGNTAPIPYGGGGISARSLTLTDSAVVGNSGNFAGAIRALDLTATNATIAGNTASFGSGGGIFANRVQLVNSTVTGNLAGDAGGGVLVSSGALTLTDSIVLGNAAPDGAPPEIAGAVAATGRNVVGADPAAFAPNGTTIVNADPALVFAETRTLADGTVAGVAADNGGPTETVLIRAGGPANGAGLGTPPATDQRGVARDATGFDLGAVELNLATVAVEQDASEPATDGAFRVGLEAPALRDTVISYAIGGSAAAGEDYRALAGALTIRAGETTATIPVAVIDDRAVEGPETVVLTLTGSDRDGIGAQDSATLTIDSDDTGPGPDPDAAIVVGFGAFRVDQNGRASGGSLDAGAGPNQIEPVWVSGPGNSGIRFQQLLALVDEDGDAATGEAAFRGFDAAFNLSDRGYGERVTSLRLDNGTDDPVQITATGRVNNSTFGDLTAAVRFADSRGFGLDNGPDGEGAARWLNRGDALDFAVQGDLREAAFTIALARPDLPAFLALDADGDTIARPGRTFVDDFELLLEVRDGERVVLDFEQGSVAVGGRAVEAEGLLAAFAAAGGDNVTLGTPAGGAALAIGELTLTVEPGDVLLT